VAETKPGRPLHDVYVLFTMDCEPAKTEVTPYGTRMSKSGPSNWAESASAIRHYVAAVRVHGFPVTLFIHPEVAANQRDLLRELQRDGACLGLHLHPYKLAGGRHRYDLGAYPYAEQRAILEEAAHLWERALRQEPRWFRGGYFSANDATFALLSELGFRGGSVSIPGRVLPSHGSVWAGAEPYPHRAHLAFRQLLGESDFVEIPVSVDWKRPVEVGEAGEQGYEWPYIPAEKYDHPQVIRGILEGVRREAPRYGTLVMDTHNDKDYADPHHPATVNLRRILDAIASAAPPLGLRPVGVTVEQLCDRLLLEEGKAPSRLGSRKEKRQ